jgi:hypothetical protein
MSKAYQARERRLNLWWSLAAIVLLLTVAAVRAQTPDRGDQPMAARMASISTL